MASLQEIERELEAVNEVVFQQLCDEFLFFSEESYPPLNRPGSQKTKRKSKKGTPDTYWALPSGKYVFCEYTTKNRRDSKTAFINKLKDDVKKCVTKTITGISPDLISKIILCFNSEILPAEMESIKKGLGKRQIEIAFHSLDTISYNLYSRFPHLASRYLPVSLDTGQVLQIEDFVTEYSSGNSITIPLNNKFFYREKELENLKNTLQTSDIVVLTGQPGVGKSKLAIEALLKWRRDNVDYAVYCLSNKNNSIFEDLQTYIKPHKNYIIFVDDANRQSENLRSVLSLLKTRRSGKLKIVITVRDYALEFIKRVCNDFRYIIEVLSPMPDEQLEEFLKSDDFGITNPSYLHRILQIAKGNPRVAIMVAKLALQHQNLEALNELFDLYDAYFTSFITDHESLSDIELQKTLGIISFFYTIDRSDKISFRKLIDLFELDYHKFSEAIVNLEKMELIESSPDNSIIKIGDQVLSTYFFYKIFIKDKILSFRTILENYFTTHRNRFSDTLIPSQSDFGYDKVIDPIQADLIEYFDLISTDEDKAYDFLSTLWFGIPDHALAYIKSKIEKFAIAENPKFAADTKNKNQTSPDDNNLKILQGYLYQNSPLLLSGLGLAFNYIERRPDLYDELYKLVITSFTFTHDDERFGFYRQKQLVNFIIDNISSGHPIYLRMFYDIFPQLMETYTRVTGTSWKRNTFSISKYLLPSNKYIKAIRKKIWLTANRFFAQDLPNSEEAIFKYIEPALDSVKEILRYDLKYLLAVIDAHFLPSKFIHCYYVQKFLSRFTQLGIVNDNFPELKKKFYSSEYKIFQLLSMDTLRNKEQHEYKNLNFDKFERIKQLEIRYKLHFGSLAQFEIFYTAFCDIHTDAHVRNWSFNASLDIILAETYVRNQELSFSFLRLIQEKQNPTGFIPARILILINDKKPEDLKPLFDLIIELDYPSKANWILGFSLHIKEEYLTTRYYSQLLQTYESLTHWVFFDFTPLPKYLKFDPRIFSKVLKAFVDTSNKGIKVTLDFHFIEEYIAYLKDDLGLLKQAYFICEKTEQAFDHNGKNIAELVKLDNNFLLEYIIHHTQHRYALSILEFRHLSSIWLLENAEELITKVFEYLTANKFYYVRQDFANAFFNNLSNDIKERVVKFLMNYMLANKKNIQKVNMAFDVFRNSLREHYFKCITNFLKANNSIRDFKKLELHNNHFSSNGKVTWADVKAEELENILGEINKLPRNSQYLEHKAYLKNRIAQEKKSADAERRRNFMDDR